MRDLSQWHAFFEMGLMKLKMPQGVLALFFSYLGEKGHRIIVTKRA
ncbi:MAG: hypothetical protein V4671_29300 [Armatimonadota bacterium]